MTDKITCQSSMNMNSNVLVQLPKLKFDGVKFSSERLSFMKCM